MPSPYPRSYYGWRIAWALAATQTIGYGVLYYAFSVMIGPMEAELGWSRGEISGAFSLALLLSGVATIPIGRWVDQRGARGLMTLGSALGVALVLAWSTVESLPAFYVIQAAIGVVMSMTFYDVAFTVIAVWFSRQRTQAMLLVTMLAGLSSTIFIPLATFLVETMDWRDGLRWLALVLALAVPLHGLVLRHRPTSLLNHQPPNQQPPGDEELAALPSAKADVSAREALRLPSFWWCTAAFALDRMVIVAVAAHSVPLLGERGFSAATVAAAAGGIGLAQVAGRLLFSFVQHVPLVRLAAATYGFHAAALIVLLPNLGLDVLWDGVPVLWLFALFFGLGNGASTLARAALVAELYGARAYGSITGLMATPIAVMQTVAPLAAGLLHDATGNYDIVLWGLIGVALLASISVSRVRVT